MSTFVQRSWVFPLVAFFTVAAFLIARPVHAVYIEPGTITIDGDFSEWPTESLVVDETGEDDVDASTWCWNTGASTWDVVDSVADCDTYFYDEENQLNIQKGYFGTNEEDMFVGFTTSVPMMSIYDVQGEEYVSIFSLMLNGITSLPRAFDHRMVFAFGPEEGEEYDYYIVAHIAVPEDMSEFLQQDDSGAFLQIYEESGDTVGFQVEEDVSLGDIDTTDSEASTQNMDSEMVTAVEIRQSIGAFFELTGLSPATYGFRYEIHSETLDVTERVTVAVTTEEESAPTVPETVYVQNIKKRQVTLKWDAVDGATYYKVRLLNQKGKKLKTFKNVTKAKKVVGRSYLKSRKTYTFKVRACNDAGCSEWSEDTQFLTNS